MIISHSRKFIFIKTRKTGSTSFEQYLMDNFTDPKTDIVTGASEYDGFNWKGTPLERSNGTAWGHAPLSLVKSICPNTDFKGYEVFCVERDPYEKTLSNWNFFRSRSEKWKNITLDSFCRQADTVPTDWDKYCLEDMFGKYNRLTFFIDYDNLFHKNVNNLLIPKELKNINFNKDDIINLRKIKHKTNVPNKKSLDDVWSSEFTLFVIDTIQEKFKNEMQYLGYRYK